MLLAEDMLDTEDCVVGCVSASTMMQQCHLEGIPSIIAPSLHVAESDSVLVDVGFEEALGLHVVVDDGLRMRTDRDGGGGGGTASGGGSGVWSSGGGLGCCSKGL